MASILLVFLTLRFKISHTRFQHIRRIPVQTDLRQAGAGHRRSEVRSTWGTCYLRLFPGCSLLFSPLNFDFCPHYQLHSLVSRNYISIFCYLVHAGKKDLFLWHLNWTTKHLEKQYRTDWSFINLAADALPAYVSRHCRHHTDLQGKWYPSLELRVQLVT